MRELLALVGHPPFRRGPAYYIVASAASRYIYSDDDWYYWLQL